MPIHDLAVAVFFAVSGYLIAGSWLTTPRCAQFLWSRFLRIFPALIALVLITTAVIGPLVATNSTREYFSHPTTFGYLQNLTTLAVYDLPGVFQSETHTRHAVNGSLWTLGVEISCYLGVLIAGLIALRKGKLGPLFLSLVLLAAVVALVSSAPGSSFMDAFTDSAPVVVYFFAAAFLRVSGPSGGYPLWGLALCLSLWTAIALFLPEFTLLASWIALPYCVIAIGRRSTPVLRRAARFGDLSYGTYLWGFVTQQVLLEVTGPIPLLPNLILVFAIVLAIAFLSWHGIEKRALRLKSRVPFLPWARRPAAEYAPR